MDVAVNPVYGVSLQPLSTGTDMFKLVDSAVTKNDREITGAVQEKPKNTKSRKASLLIGIALFTAILALLLAAVSVGLTMTFNFNTEMKSLANQLPNGQSTALNSTADIQSLTAAVMKLQLKLDQSVNTIEDLGRHISAVGLQANTTIQYENEVLRGRVSQLEGLINETLDVQLKVINDSLMDTQLQVSDKATELTMVSQTLEALRQSVSQQEGLVNSIQLQISQEATEMMVNLEQVSQRLDVQLKVINDSLMDTQLQVSDKATELTMVSQTLEALRQSVSQQEDLVNSIQLQISQEATEMMVNLEQVSQNQRAVYTRWGKSSCPHTAVKVYNGVVGGSSYPNQGGGSNHLCMPFDPEYPLQYQSGVQDFSRIFGSEYETAYLGDQNVNVPCAVCSVSTRTQALMIPAKISCPTGWTREYFGYLMSEHRENYRSSFICVDRDHEGVPNTSGHAEANDLWQTEADCSLHRCPPYIADKELVCVVCSK